VRKRTLTLDDEARLALEHMRDHHPTPYLRERASALLKIADGMATYAVARHGLLKRRKADTVYAWLNAYQQYGLAGLYQKPRRQRRFPPQDGAAM
jgi:hypothetical protein